MACDLLLIFKTLCSVLTDTVITWSVYCRSCLVHIANGTSVQLEFSTGLQMNIPTTVITWEGGVKKKQHSLRFALLITIYLNVMTITVLVSKICVYKAQGNVSYLFLQ
jgi:late competence protein required for DNA uptake (superfamily II DNA/RNA helicase)